MTAQEMLQLKRAVKAAIGHDCKPDQFYSLLSELDPNWTRDKFTFILDQVPYRSSDPGWCDKFLDFVLSSGQPFEPTMHTLGTQTSPRSDGGAVESIPMTVTNPRPDSQPRINFASADDAIFAATEALAETRLRAFASYVPSVGLRLIESTRSRPEPCCVYTYGAAVIVDLSGFTKMCAALAETGPQKANAMSKKGTTANLVQDHLRFDNVDHQRAAAAEAAEKIVDENFDPLIDVISAFGGDILRIAGDAIIVLFEIEVEEDDGEGLTTPRANKEEIAVDSIDAQECARKAAACALACIDLFNAEEISMPVHVGMSMGNMRRFHVGDHSCWQVVVAGKPIEDAGVALTASERLEVVCTPEMWQLLKDSNCTSDDKFEGKEYVDKEGGCFLLTLANKDQGQAKKHVVSQSSKTNEASLSASFKRKSVFAAAPSYDDDDVSGWDSCAQWRSHLLSHWDDAGMGMTQAAKRALLMYVPSVVQQGITGMAGALHEIRKLTCVFIDIDLNLHGGDEGETLKKLQSVYSVCVRLGVNMGQGFVKELTCDDKGLVCILAFGFHSAQEEFGGETEHEFSPTALACTAAVRIEKALAELDVSCCIGIACGMMFCAALGNDLRRELGLVSSYMNLSARLMCAVKKGAKAGVHLDQGSEDGISAARVEHERLQGPVKAGTALTDRQPFEPPVFSLRVLVTPEVRDDALATPGLFFHSLPAIPLKGFPSGCVIVMVGLSSALLDVKADPDATLGAPELDSVRKQLKLESSSTNEISESFGVLDDTRQASRSRAADLKRIDPLGYSHYAQLAPILFARQFEKTPYFVTEMRDIVWLRARGDSAAVKEFMMQIERDSRKGGEWAAEVAMVSRLAVEVPAETLTRKMKQVARLSGISQVVLRIIAVLGGRGDTELIRHLLETKVKPYAKLRDAVEQAMSSGGGGERAGGSNASSGLQQGGRSIFEMIAEREAVKAEGLDVLNLVLANLVEHGVLEDTDITKEVECKDFLIVDALYSQLPFAHRVELHSDAALWLEEETRQSGDFCRLLPHMIHHLKLGEHDGESETFLKVACRMGGKQYVENFIVQEVQSYLPSLQEEADTKGAAAAYGRAKKALGALPYLRGLAKVMQQLGVSEATMKAKQAFLFGRSKG